MKLLKTIKRLIEESEKRLEEASQNGVSEIELEKLEKNYNDSLNLLEIYKKNSDSYIKDNLKK